MKGVKYICPIRDHCYSDDTEVLTDSGWKLFSDLLYSDKLATLSAEQCLEYHSPEKIISVPWEGDLLRFYSPDGIDLLVSPNHSMYVQNEYSRRKYGVRDGWGPEKASECFGKYRFYKKDAPHYLQRGPEVIEVCGRKIKTEEWLDFLGYYLSEGSSTTTKRKDYIVQLRQVKNDEDLRKMAESLDRVTPNKINIRPDGRVIVNDKSLCLYLKSTFGNCYTKHIPRSILNSCSREQLSILYNSLVVGDGKITSDDESGGSYYATSSVQLRDDFQELQFKVGLSGDYSFRTGPGHKTVLSDGRTITGTTVCWGVSIRRKRGGTFMPSINSVVGERSSRKFEKVFYKGSIYCATVKNHVMYVRREGKAVWCGNSGYGEASRSYVLALHAAGIPLTVHPHCFEPDPPPVGTASERAIFDSLVNKDIDFDIVIVHLTPDLAPPYVQQYADKYVISYTVWETSKLHPLWVDACNKVNEVWVPSEWNIKSFRDSGVTVPLFKIHHGIDPDTYLHTDPSKFTITGLDKDNTFVFYSIMQWNARKNPDGLLRAYFNAFTAEDNVRLVLKAYVGRGLPSHEEMRQLKEMIKRIKADMQLPYFPKMNLIVDSLSTEQMRALHLYGDAYVSLPHGEGFGLTSFEAGLAGNPVIVTGVGGQMEYMTEENSYPVSYMWEFVAGMGSFNPWYWGNQEWARPSNVEAARLMRYVYDNRAAATEKAKKLQSRIKTEFNWEAVANQMITRLKAL